MLFLLISAAFSIDAKSVLQGKWSAYPGSAKSYSPQLKYTILFSEDEFEHHVYGSIWEADKAPTESNPRPAQEYFIGDVKLYFKTSDNGYYVGGSDRHWYPFSFLSYRNGKVCNISTQSGHKFGIFILSEKVLELTMKNPDGTIPHQLLCFFGSNVNTTAAGNYVKQLHPAPMLQISQSTDASDYFFVAEDFEPGNQPTITQTISTTTIIVCISAFVVFQLFLCTCIMCCRVCA